jgi:hypothetical protein
MKSLLHTLSRGALVALTAAMCSCASRDDTSLSEGDPSDNLDSSEERTTVLDPVLQNQLDAAQWQREDDGRRSRQREADGDFMGRWMNTE